MFKLLERINERPKPFQFYTAGELWTNDHTSAQMLSYHLDDDVDLSSRNSAFVKRSVAWIATRFDIGNGKKIADFGCGPGLYAAKLAHCGGDVTGIDFSKRSIDYARKVAVDEQLNINYVAQNYLDFETEDRFDLVLMIMCDFCALNPKQRRALLGKFKHILKPGGSVLLDVYSLAAFDQRKEAAGYEGNLLNGFWSPQKYYGFLNTFKYDKEKVVLDKYTIVEPDRIRTVYNWLQYFTPEKLEREFLKSGFSVEALFSDVAGTSYDEKADELAIIAQKS